MKAKKIRICFAALTLFLAVGLYLLLKNYTTKQHNVVLILIDTLRADHLGAYGYKRDTSPNIDKLAAESLIFSRAISVAPWTAPSVASILTGLSVARHGHNPNLRTGIALQGGQVLREELDTLPELLQRAGYQTSGVSSNPWISEEFNFDQGFDSFHYEKRSSTEVTFANAKNALATLLEKPEKPFFLYVHILDPHGPYKPKKKFAKMFHGKVEGTWPYDEKVQRMVNLYDAEIREVDEALGDFLTNLKAQDNYENTSIFLISDHGEQFDERGDIGHGKQLYMEEVHVPFIAKCNGKRGTIDDVVSNLDVTTSVLSCLDIKVPNKFDGISVFDSEVVKKRTGIFSSVNRAFLQEAYTTADGMRLLRSKGRVHELKQDWENNGFDLSKDPLEQKPIVEHELISELTGSIDSAKNVLTPKDEIETQSVPVSKESLKELESLGYINE